MSASKTEKVLGQVATLFRDGQVPIYVLPDGRYAAHWGGKWLVRASLKSLDAKVTGVRPSVKLMTFSDSISFNSRSVNTVEAAEYEDSKIIDKDGKRVHATWSRYWLYDEEAYRALVDLEARRMKIEKDLNNELLRIMEGLTRVHSCDFKEFLPAEQKEEKGS